VTEEGNASADEPTMRRLFVRSLPSGCHTSTLATDDL
jgi:hypothetical protein